jgi:hypothetical protein
MTTLQCHQVSKSDKNIRTVYLAEVIDANLITTDTSQRMKVGDLLVFCVKVPRCRNTCDLAFRMNRNMKTLTTTAWNPGLTKPKVGNRASGRKGQPVVLKVVSARHCTF